MGIVFDQPLNTTDNVQFVSLSLGDDTKLVRDSANTFAMRNGTSPNNLNVYNTYTSNTDYERLEVKWDSGVPTIAVAVDGNGNYPNWLQIQNESSKFLVKHNGFEFQDATTLLQLNPTNIKVFKDFYPNNDGETSFGTSNNRWLHTYSVNGSFSGDLVVEDGGNQYIYNTYTDASNYERLELKWNISNVAEINTAAAGTGIVRTLRMRQSGGSYWADWEAAGIKFYGAASLNFNVGSAATAFYKNINPDTNVSVSCGVSASRWSNTYSIDGSFSGDLNIEDGGYFKLFGLGDSHTNTVNTQWLEISSTTQSFSIATLATGTGVSRDIYMSVGGTSNIMLRSDHTRLMQYVRPQTTNTTDIGTSSFRFRKSYLVDGSFSGDFVIEDGGSQYFYNTYTDASNYERLEIKWDSNEATIATTADGTGAQRQLVLNGSSVLTKIAGINKFNVSSAINYSYQTLQPGSDSVHTLGASPRRWSTTYTDSIAIGQNTLDAILTADAADTLALRNSTTAQAFNVYNTYTDASNYERLEIFGNGSEYRILSAADGTGAYRNIRLGGYQPSDTSFRGIRLDTSNGIFEWIYNNATKLRCDSTTFNVSATTTTTQDVRPKLDSSYDLGSDAIRWTNTYTNTITIGDGVDAVLTASADNILELTSGAAADQEFRIVGEDDGGGNREWLELRCASNGATFITTGGDGTGTGASVRIGGSGSSIIEVSSANTVSNGAIVPGTDSSYNLGVSSKRWFNTYTDTITIGNGVDAVLTADAADELALRNSTNAQALHVYNTYTDASNYERLEIGWASNSSFIKPAIDGTGSDRKLVISGSDPSEANIEFGESGDVNIRYGGTNNIRIAGPNVSIGSDIYPNSDGVRELGRTNLRWSNTYSVDGDFSGDLTVSGPEGKLVLSGQSSAFDTTSGAVSTIYQSDDDGGSYPFTSVGNLILQSRQNSNRDIVFATGTTPTVRMVVAGNGNVGIGTNTPTSRLHVVGDIYNTGTITTDGGFADLLAVSGTSAPELRINSTDSVIFDGDEFGRLQWYMNDANTNGTGAAARISAIFNDTVSGSPAQQTAGEGTDLVFSTGLVLVTGQTQTVTEKLRIDKNGTFKHAVGTNSYWYNLDTDASNYERLEVKWDTNEAQVATTKVGTGQFRGVYTGILDGSTKRQGFLMDSTLVSSYWSLGSQCYIFSSTSFRPNGDRILGNSSNRWSNTYTEAITIGDGVDVVLTADADNQLALRNSTNAQRFNIYNTYTDASNYERGQFRWGSNILVIGTESAGTGSNRSVWVNIGTSSTKFEFNSTTNKSNQNLQPGTDIVYNLGATSARWANTYTNRLYASDELVVGATSSSSVYHEVELYKRTLIESTSSQLFTVRKSGDPEMLNINSSQRVIRLFGNSDTGSADSNSLQIFGSQYLYNTYTDASNYERLEVKFDTNEAVITPTAAGTGTQRDLVLDGPDIRFRINGTDRFTINKSTSRVETGFDFRPISNNAVSCGAGDRRWFATYTNGLRTAIQTITAASDTLGGNDNINLCDCTSNNITINLPAASGREGLQYHIKKIDSSSNTVTVDADGTETIDGALTQVISAQYESITIVCDGSNWHII